jgi:Importin-beta N-terminal domain
MSQPNFANPADLTTVLNMLSVGDTDVIKQGEQLLKPFLKNPGCIPALLGQVQSCPHAAVRQHASLLLKKKVGKLFKKFTPQQQADLKTQLIQVMVSEPEKLVRTALAGTVSQLAKSVLNGGGEWNELFGLFNTLLQSADEAMRALSFSLLEQVPYSCIFIPSGFPFVVLNPSYEYPSIHICAALRECW